jgi:hypothetical protein
MTSRETILIQLGVVTWVSFLLAGLATILFFATFDPPKLGEIATFPTELGRSAGYTIGFLLFWLLLMINGLVVSWLGSKYTDSGNKDIVTHDH